VPALPVVFTRRAAREVEEVARWWTANRLAASDAVEADLAAALTLIGEQPTCGAPTVSRRYRGLRRVHLARIGYHLYYRIAPRLRQVEVVAFWHARRELPPRL
jgi:plasmid stabilization system protein ParE